MCRPSAGPTSTTPCILQLAPENCGEGLDTGAFLLPSVPDPAAFASHHFDVYKGDADGELKVKFAKGTTTLAFKFKGGVVVSVDSRSTQGPYIGELHSFGRTVRSAPVTVPPCRSLGERQEDH